MKTLSRSLSSLLPCFALFVSTASILAAATPTLSVEFDDVGIAKLELGGHPLLNNGEVKVREILLSDTYRNRNKESDDSMYLADERIKEPGHAVPLERFFNREARRTVHIYEWGELLVDYKVHADRIDFEIEVKNKEDRVIEFLELELLTLNLERETKTEIHSSIAGRSRSNRNLEGPDILKADFEKGRIVFLSMRHEEPLVQRIIRRSSPTERGWWGVSVAAGSRTGGAEILDGIWDVRPIQPGESDRYSLSLRFAVDHKSDPYEMARDLLESYAEAVPFQFSWPDRRPIGSVHVADSRTNEKNPRGWKMGIDIPKDYDIAEDPDFSIFREAALRGARNIVNTNLRLGSQGVIVWQPEGMQYRHSYYGDPRVIQFTAPEMDAVIDDYFEEFRKAGLRYGVTLRPILTIPVDASGTIVPWEDAVAFAGHQWMREIPEFLQDVYHPSEARDMLPRLDRKIQYAKDRWGATLFYFDANNIWRPRDRSNGEISNWQAKLLTARIMEELQRLHPDCLIIPEHQNLRYYASAPQYVQPPVYGQFITDRHVKMVYPEAFSVIANTASREHFLENAELYQRGVRQGDVFLPHGWYAGWANVMDFFHAPVAVESPFQVYVNEDGSIELNGNRAPTPEALLAALKEQVTGDAPLAERRAYIGYHPKADYPANVVPVIDAVGRSGAVITWSQPKTVEQLKAEIEKRQGK